MKNSEIEVKYFVKDLEAVERKAQALGAELVQPRVFETNLRFDTPDRTYTRSGRTVRLRRDTAARLTFKGPSNFTSGARQRTELEFVASDFDLAKAFLEALGLNVVLIYEKYRATYDLNEVHVTLDEMPYGTFVELEGPDAERILAVSNRLGLKWEARIPDSYTVLFERLQKQLNLHFRDLSFANFKDRGVTVSYIGINPAD